MHGNWHNELLQETPTWQVTESDDNILQSVHDNIMGISPPLHDIYVHIIKIQKRHHVLRSYQLVQRKLMVFPFSMLHNNV